MNGEKIGYEQLREENSVVDLDFKARDLALTQFSNLKKHYKLFVNVSPQEMHKPLFFEDVNLTNVVLEITEESSVKDAARSIKRLNNLRKNGLRVALDDFGTKHQNYDKLNEYEPDFIKLDKSIAKNGDLDLFTSYISKYEVIVEGIESKEQLQSCVSLGFHYVQGYHLSTPLSYEVMLAVLGNGSLQESIRKKLNE